MPPRSFQSILSGDTRDLFGVLARGALSALEPFYLAATTVRNLGYDSGFLRSHAAAVPIVSIGNVTTGGTGKTPTVAWVTQQLQQLGARPALLSRGYRSLDDSGNDEFRVLNHLCPGVPHLQQPNRVTGVQQLVREEACSVVVLDDAFQHRRLRRDLDVVLIDALNPFGYGHLLPRGLLRESLRGLKRADVILITRGEAVSSEVLDDLQTQLRRWTSGPIVRTQFIPTGFRSLNGEFIAISECQSILSAKRPAAFCGIGNPAGFEATLAGVLPQPVSARSFPDHHHYTPADVDQLRERPADVWITTLKDLVKLPADAFGTTPLFALEIGLDFLDDPAPVLDRLQGLMG